MNIEMIEKIERNFEIISPLGQNKPVDFKTLISVMDIC